MGGRGLNGAGTASSQRVRNMRLASFREGIGGMFEKRMPPCKPLQLATLSLISTDRRITMPPKRKPPRNCANCENGTLAVCRTSGGCSVRIRL